MKAQLKQSNPITKLVKHCMPLLALAALLSCSKPHPDRLGTIIPPKPPVVEPFSDTDSNPVQVSTAKLIEKQDESSKLPSVCSKIKVGEYNQKCGKVTCAEHCSLQNEDITDRIGIERYESAPLNSIETISRFPYKEMIKFLNIKEGDEVKIAYPAAGVHIGVLQFGIRLQQLIDVTVSYTLTDIFSASSFVLHSFNELLSKLYPYVKVINTSYAADSITFDLDVFGKKQVVRYMFNDEKISLPVRVQHNIALEADVFFTHDSFDYCSPRRYCETEAFAFGGVYSVFSKKPKIVIQDDFAYSFEKSSHRSYYNTLPGKVLGVRGAYGCASFGIPGAIIYFPNEMKFGEILSSPDSISSFNTFLRNFTFGSSGYGQNCILLDGEECRGEYTPSHFETAVAEIRKYAESVAKLENK